MNAAYLIVAAPLAGYVILLFAGKRLGEPLAGVLATVLAFASFAGAIIAWIALLGRSGAHRTVQLNIFTWIPVDRLHVAMALQVDQLSMVMALFCTGVGSVITLYSIGYMKGDPDFPRFFCLMNLFLFSMVTLVLANNFLFMFLGWEGVGFCSYALIAFWFDRNIAAVAGTKAFLVNRVGDIGFMIALFLIYVHFGSFDYSKVLAPLAGGGTLPHVTATAIGLTLFLGAAGKSAQGPLYMWLPDAMEGPTPVSALIHAATMVTAGVYLVARAAPIIHFSTSTQWVIACVGAGTAFFAATVACAQDDIKKVLAYSTLSQLGYMFLGEGAGSYTSGLFHMVMHAFFKALLFLAAGSVIHAMRDEQSMKKMGALKKYLPLTFPTFVCGYLALSGIPPFDGFWSKDEVLDAAWHMSKALWVVGAVTAGLTAYYMSRQVALVFLGKARWSEATPVVVTVEAEGSSGGPEATGPEERVGEEHGHASKPHEPTAIMTIPLVVLAVASTIGWLLNAPFASLDYMDRWLAPVFPSSIDPAFTVSTDTKWVLGIVTTAFCFIGLFVGLRAWRTGLRPKLEPAFLERSWYADDSLAHFVSGPLSRSADALAFDVDGRGIAGSMNGLGRLTAATGRQLRRIQTGYVRNYALGFAVGVVAVLIFVAARVGG